MTCKHISDAKYNLKCCKISKHYFYMYTQVKRDCISLIFILFAAACKLFSSSLALTRSLAHSFLYYFYALLRKYLYPSSFPLVIETSLYPSLWSAMHMRYSLIDLKPYDYNDLMKLRCATVKIDNLSQNHSLLIFLMFFTLQSFAAVSIILRAHFYGKIDKFCVYLCGHYHSIFSWVCNIGRKQNHNFLDVKEC